MNVQTIGEAPHEVHAYLTNLRTELLEEKASLKIMRKGMKKHQRMLRKEDRGSIMGMELDDVTLKTMGDSIRHLIRQFRDLEKPFLEPGEAGIGDATNHRTRARRRDSSHSPPHYDHAAYASPPEKTPRPRSRARTNHDRDQHLDEETEEDAFWAQRTRYSKFTLRRRFQWLTRKAKAQELFEILTRVQVRIFRKNMHLGVRVFVRPTPLLYKKTN